MGCASSKKVSPPGSADGTKKKTKDKTFLLKTLDEHTGAINSICLSNDRQTIVTVSEDHTARLWDLKMEECIGVLEGHTSYITNCCVSEEHVFTASADYSVRKWDLKTCECLHEFNGHTSTVNKIIFSQGLLFSGSYDRTARVWDVRSGDLLRVFEGHHRSLFPLLLVSNSKTRRAHVDLDSNDDILITGSADYTAKSWGMNSNQCLVTFKKHTGAVLSLAVDSNNKTLFTGSTDTTICMWDLLSGRHLKTLEGHLATVLNLQVSFLNLRFRNTADFFLTSIFKVL